jgi:hypothetical protein
MKKYLVIFLLFFFSLGMFLLLLNGNSNHGSIDTETEIVTVGLPEAVLQYKEIVKQEAIANEIPDKVNTLLAIMAVESGRKGNDVMQSSESLGLPPNSLQPIESIKQGVKYYASLLRFVRVKDCDDDVAIASYNFGGGYISFVVNTGKKHTLKIAEQFSREVVAPSLGNTTGEKYYYPNPIANNHGNYLYWNGGNFFYVDLVKEYLTSSSSTIEILNNILGQSIYNGECYGLTAYYVEQLGGPKMMGSGFMYAENIGSDYDWEKYGWTVIFSPKLDEIQAGDVINWRAGSPLAPGIWGHTGVISSVNKNGQIGTYEQNSEKGRIVAKYDRTFISSDVKSIVRKNK